MGSYAYYPLTSFLGEEVLAPTVWGAGKADRGYTSNTLFSKL